MKAALSLLLSSLALCVALAEDKTLYRTEFATTPLGKVPPGWKDQGIVRANPVWAVDGNGLLRVMWKGDVGLITYDGALADGKPAASLTDGIVSTEFQKAADPKISIGLVGRWKDAKNYYVARFVGTRDLQLNKVTDGQEETLATLPVRKYYQEGEKWRLSLSFEGQRLTAQIFDQTGEEQARVDALEETGWLEGTVGLQATNYAGIANFNLSAPKPFTATLTAEQINERNRASLETLDDLVVKPASDVEKLNTPFDKLAASYDVVVAGAGTSGWAAAIQAARMGVKVLLVEETDWIGGQMSAAAVTSMDESGLAAKFPVRERGIYREFNQSMVNFYYTLNKDPFRAYYSWPVQLEGGYEPKWTRAVLYAFIAEARKKGVLDLVTGTAITKVSKEGDKVTGVDLEKDGAKKSVASKVLVEATEYGDILPLAGARYRAGTVTSENLVPDSPVQYDTYLGVIREYPEGLPEHLKIKEAPPGYEVNRYKKSQLYGKLIWGSPGKDYKGPRQYHVLLAWRGMADADSPATGKLTEGRHTQAGLNGGYQDYHMDVKSLEDMDARRAGQRDGIYRTLSVIYYLQHELGLPWGLAEDEGYNTPYNQKVKASLELRPDLAPLAKYMPQMPYVRESRRGRGIYTLRTTDMGRYENARLWPTSLAMGDYFMDIDHGGTGEDFEHDLDPVKPPREGGPFQVPFEVFVPEKIDGLVFAEKNISQSRIVNGATRLQPSTMLMGQAAGAIAAMAVIDGVQPRQLNPIHVQAVLLEAGSNLIQRWYDDIVWGTRLWQATQFLSLYGVMDETGPYSKEQGQSMSGGNTWRPDAPLEAKTFATAIKRLAELAAKPAPAAPSSISWNSVGTALKAIDAKWQPSARPTEPVTRAQFALAAAEVLRQTGKPVLMTDAAAPPVQAPVAASTPVDKKQAAKEAKLKKKKEKAEREAAAEADGQ